MIANPRSIKLRLIYARWLASVGETNRAEFIRVQCALQSIAKGSPKRAALSARAHELIDSFGEQWLGQLVLSVPKRRLQLSDAPTALTYWYSSPKRAEQFHYEFGFLGRMKLNPIYSADLDRLAAAWEIKLITKVQLSGIELETAPPGTQPLFARLAASDLFPNVESLVLGTGEADEFGYTLGQSPHLVDFIASLHRLREFRILDFDCDFSRLFSLSTLRELRALRIYSPWTTPLPLRDLARNPAFARLQHFEATPKLAATPIEPPLIEVPDVEALVSSSRLPALRSLSLSCVPLGPDGCRMLSNSNMFTRLSVIRISDCRLDDAALGVFASTPAFSELKLLDLRSRLSGSSEEYGLLDTYSSDAVDQLRRRGVKVLADPSA